MNAYLLAKSPAVHLEPVTSLSGVTLDGPVNQKWVSPECNEVISRDSACRQPGEAWFVLSLTFADLEDEMTWAIHNNTDSREQLVNQIVSLQDVDKDSSSVVQEVCLPWTATTCLTLSLGGDFRLDYLLAILDGQELESKQFFNPREKLVFGECKLGDGTNISKEKSG
eukprot:CAMPEP_0116848932 /NCGR_PEP_ID=MMETSP0418-20121206/15288_1 /TAXON_ID=1158023 /ORGANISM="Astrosyne radiata, Strain 13vi08-1A" /LENGTH=167 /DNA_ID=CAMNT_0004480591 /DNA_START=163 /DNA_END=666 /DNA_ORIENTATION=-